MTQVWHLLKRTALDYIDDNCLSRGVAIAYYTVFSLAPVLVIAIAVAGPAFGQDAAQGAIVRPPDQPRIGDEPGVFCCWSRWSSAPD